MVTKRNNEEYYEEQLCTLIRGWLERDSDRDELLLDNIAQGLIKQFVTLAALSATPNITFVGWLADIQQIWIELQAEREVT